MGAGSTLRRGGLLGSLGSYFHISHLIRLAKASRITGGIQ
jgi:hypothetical protein